jgi:hypothetical protein
MVLASVDFFLAGDFSKSLPAIEEHAGDFRVQLVARAGRHDVGLQGQAEQHDVPDDIENLVTNELVLKPQRLLRQDVARP